MYIYKDAVNLTAAQIAQAALIFVIHKKASLLLFFYSHPMTMNIVTFILFFALYFINVSLDPMLE